MKPLESTASLRGIRQPAVAGLFYPGDASECQQSVDTMLRRALAPETPLPKALIVPHAGYMYSGAVAATAYKKLVQHRLHYSRVVLLGPSHRVAFRGIAGPECKAFRTPVGDVDVDVQELQRLCASGSIVVLQEAHRYEHSLEVQLPFLQRVLEHFLLVPLVVGDCDADAVAGIIGHFWQQSETLIVVSSDLSHYHDYEHACDKDRHTVALIEERRAVLDGDQACGCVVLNGLLRYAAAMDAEIECVDQRNSGDTAGDRSRVVGYGSFIVY